MINVPSTLNILLRHVRSLIPFVIGIPSTRQNLVKVKQKAKRRIDKENSFNFVFFSSFVKELIHIWSTASDERSRVIAFVCLFHLVRENRKEIMSVVLRVRKTFSFVVENLC